MKTSIKKGDTIWVLAALKEGAVFPRTVHEVRMRYGRMEIKCTRFCDTFDPPLLPEQVITNQQEAISIALAALEEKKASMEERIASLQEQQQPAMAA